MASTETQIVMFCLFCFFFLVSCLCLLLDDREREGVGWLLTLVRRSSGAWNSDFAMEAEAMAMARTARTRYAVRTPR